MPDEPRSRPCRCGRRRGRRRWSRGCSISSRSGIVDAVDARPARRARTRSRRRPARRDTPRRPRQRVDVLGRLVPRILEHAALDRAAPQVRVRPVGTVDRRGTGIRRAVAYSISSARVMSHSAPARSPGSPGRARATPSVEAHLVVALAGAAVRDGRGALHVRDLDELRAMSGRASAVASGYASS